MNDVRCAFRQLLKNPGFTAVAALTLALGIGATTAIFSVVNAVLLRPLPYPESDRLVELTDSGGPIAIPNFIDWKEQQTVLEHLALYRAAEFNVLAGQGAPLRVLGVELSAEAFAALRMEPAIGRFYFPEEDVPGGPPVTVLSHEFWQTQFGGDPDVVSKSLPLNGITYTVLGVAPASFDLIEGAAVFVPVEPGISESIRRNRNSRASYQALGRLKRGVTVEEAKAEFVIISGRLAELYPDSNKDRPIGVQPLIEAKVGGARRALWILLGAATLVLLIACANVANLLMVRAAGRRQEMAVRAALGADHGRIIRQMLTESVVLAGLGAAIGLVLARGSMATIIALSHGNLPRANEIGIDGGVLLFSVTMALLTGILFGFAPAWQSSRPDLSSVFNNASRGSSASRNSLLQGVVIGQVALTLVLLFGACLLLRSFHRLLQVNPGFDYVRVLTFRLHLPDARYGGPSHIDQFSQELLERLRGVPGVQDVSLATQIPLDDRGWATPFVVEGRPEPAPSEAAILELNLVGSDYFRALGISILRGRAFNETDSRQHSPDPDTGQPDFLALKTIIIDEEFVRRFFPNGDPIGERIRLPWGERDQNPVLTVVGVVGRVKHETLREENSKVLPMAYLPYRERPNRHIAVVLKTTLRPETLLTASREQVAAIDPGLPVYDARTLAEMRRDNIAPERMNLTLLGLTAAIALALAVIGIYGVVAFAVAQRQREIGIRLALGAQRGNVMGLILGQGMRLVLIGTVLGLVGAFGFSRVLAGLLYQVTPTDLLTFTIVPLILMGAAAFACVLPARRAAHFDPVELLRS
jgi:putative ABC transport system permease protein